MKPNIIVKYGYNRSTDGKRMPRWEIEFNGVYLGRFKSRRSAISALTVRKIPHEEAKELIKT